MKPLKINKYVFLGELFEELKSQGFVLQINDYTDLFDLVKDEEDLETIKLILAPVICTNPEQQTEFYKLFDVIKSKQKKIIPPAKPPYYLLLLLPLLFLVYYYFYGTEDKINFNAQAFITTSDSSDTYYTEFSTNQFFEDNPSLNKKDFTFHVTSDSINYKGFHKKFKFDDLKQHQFQIKIVSPKNEIDTTFVLPYISFPYIDYDFQLDENNLFQETSFKSILEAKVGDTVSFSFTTNKKFQDSTKLFLVQSKELKDSDTEYINLIEKSEFADDSIVASGMKTQLYKHVFKEKGQYIFRGVIYKMIMADGKIKYTATQKMIVNVVPQNGLDIIPAEKDTIQSSNINKQWIFFCSLASLLLCFLIWISYRKRNPKQQINPNDETVIDFSGNNPPFNLNFKNKNHKIKKDHKLKTWISELYVNVVSHRYDVNVEKTINKTIENFGYIIPVFQQTLRARRYTILVNKKFVKSTQFSLFNYLIENFKTNNLPFDYFFFKDINMLYDQNNQIVSINEILERCSENTFIFFSDGYHFINYQTNDINPLEKKLFSIVENKIVVTPIPYLDWGAEEKLLRNHLPIIPADFVGLLQLIQTLNNDQKFASLATYHSKYINFFSIDELKNYLQDSDVFQWVCALAVYPKIQWELIISIGNHLAPDKVTYSNLLKITRIKWLNEASFPVDLRLDLLNELTVDNEIKTREFILKLLETEFMEVSEDQFIHQELETQKYINSFIVYANDTSKTQFRENAEKYIIQLNNGKIIDTAVIEYLKNNTGSATEHPLQKEDYTNIDQFIDKHELDKIKETEEKQKINSRKKLQFIIYSLLGLIPLLALFILSLMFTDTKYEAFLKEIHFIQTTTTVPDDDSVTFTFKYNNCFEKGSSIRYAFYKTSESDTNNQYSLFAGWSVDSSQTAMRFNRADFEKDTMYTLVILNSEDSKKYEGSFIYNSEKNYTVDLRCASDAPPLPMVYIQYYPTSDRQKATEFVEQMKKINTFQFDKIDYNGNKINGVRYFKDEDKTKAEYLAEEASRFFGITIEAKKSKIKSAKNKYSHLELWINNTNPCKPYSQGEKYILYSGKGATTLTDESKKLLDNKLKTSNNYIINIDGDSSSKQSYGFLTSVIEYMRNYILENKIECEIKITKEGKNNLSSPSECGYPIELIFEKKTTTPTTSPESANPTPDYTIVAIAEKEIGYTENPPGSNKTKYGEWYGIDGNSWSAIFISWVYAQSGKQIQKGTKGFAAYVQMRNYAKQNNMITSNPVPGDIYFIIYQGGNGHGGIFVRWLDEKKTQFEAIEGNSNDTSVSSGTKVVKRIRNYTSDMSFIHIE